MRHQWLKAAAVLLVLPVSNTAIADDNFGLGIRAGTLGAGIEGTWRPLPWIDLRLGHSLYDYDTTRNDAGIEYDALLELSNTYGTANFHFPISPMRLTVGAYTNSNELTLTSTAATAYDIGALTGLSPADVGTLSSTTSFNGAAPYLGIGFDFTLMSRVGMNLDFGVLWEGEPEVTLTSTGALANDPGFIAELEAERVELEAEFSDYKAYPLVSVGVFVNF